MFDAPAPNRLAAASRSLLIPRRIDVPLALSIAAMAAFYLSLKPENRPFDYTYRVAQTSLFVLSVLVNGFATYQWYWTNQIQP